MRLVVLPLAIACATACHSNATTPDADEAMACIATGRGDTYVAGLERAGAGGLVNVKLMAADPAPPGFNNNTWVIQVNAMAAGVVGAPLDGASITVTPFMPDHQHGTGFRAEIETLPGGQYRLSPINLWMPGYWEVTIGVTSGAVHDSVVYKFCIQA